MAKAIPEGLHTVTTQLSVEGASDAIAFYKRAFGAEEVSRAPDPSGKKIWHAQIRIGTSALFINDIFPEMGGKAEPVSLWIYVDGIDAAFKRATDAGATAKMPPADMFWGDRMGAVQDKWGNTWNIAQRMKDLSPAEMKAAGERFAAEQTAKKN